jgi:hypothetical protein
VTTSVPATPFTDPAPVECLERLAAALTAKNFAVEILDDAAAGARVIWVVGAQKVVPDLPAALRRVEDHCLPLESERTMKVYGQPSAINRVLILNAEPHPGRGTVLLLREAIGF